MALELDELVRSFPLGVGWNLLPPYQETVKVGGLTLRLAGLSAQDITGREVVGSAVEIGTESPFVRAYFELIERISILDHERYKRNVEGLDEKLVFPTEDSKLKWKYSKSNGVAVHVHQNLAKRSAEFELMERDRILRCWYGEFMPVLREVESNPILNELSEYYEIQVAEFGAEVVGVFGFPKLNEYPVIMGFGKGQTFENALEHAVKEMLQRLGFLLGEKEDDNLLPPIPSPDFHVRFFSTPRGIQNLRSWLQGQNLRRAKFIVKPSVSTDIKFLDITPEHLREKLWVYRCIGEQFLPLTFGLGNPRIICPEDLETQLDTLVHPIG